MASAAATSSPASAAADTSVDAAVTIALDHQSRVVYVNNIPHLGNIIGCVLSADVYARYCRLRGYNTLFICGTDEYGTATETKALEENMTCQEICDKYHAHHKNTYDWFNIDFDYFGRTTTKEQTRITQDIFTKLDKNGKTEEQVVTQLYCEKHQSFLADRFVTGVCPRCSYDDARGDQCDACGNLLNAVELINPKCKLDGATPVIRDSTHIFLNLTDLQPVVESWVNKSSVEEYLQYENKKFSKSRGVGVFGNNVADSQIPSDVWRYYLLSNRPETGDSQFGWDAFLQANNSELLANLGNLVSRVMKFASSNYGGIVPAYPTKEGFAADIDRTFVERINELLAQYLETMDEAKSLRAGLRVAMDASSATNQFLQDNRLDNKLFEGSRERCDAVINLAVNACYLLSALVGPFLPVTAEGIVRQLGLPARRLTDTWSGRDVRGGHRLGKADYLFKIIDPKRAEELREKYSGSQSADAAAAAATAGAKAAKKGKKVAAAGIDKKAALLAEVPAGVGRTSELDALEAAVRARGEAVRRLKEAKAAKDEVAAAVALLNAAKEELTKAVAAALEGLGLQ
ncbi:hypothetical protein HK405_008045 [Cladochytrium tenue]|nr:hypothetical protein HK405_008045 [Cladochytrium tenue]